MFRINQGRVFQFSWLRLFLNTSKTQSVIHLTSCLTRTPLPVLANINNHKTMPGYSPSTCSWVKPCPMPWSAQLNIMRDVSMFWSPSSSSSTWLFPLRDGACMVGKQYYHQSLAKYTTTKTGMDLNHCGVW